MIGDSKISRSAKQAVMSPGGGILLYMLYEYVPRDRVRFFSSYVWGRVLIFTFYSWDRVAFCQGQGMVSAIKSHLASMINSNK